MCELPQRHQALSLSLRSPYYYKHPCSSGRLLPPPVSPRFPQDPTLMAPAHSKVHDEDQAKAMSRRGSWVDCISVEKAPVRLGIPSGT